MINLSIKSHSNIKHPLATMQPTTNFPRGGGTSFQVWLKSKAIILSIMACFHPGWDNISWIVLGIETNERVETTKSKETISDNSKL
jgi:hypothetical protein